MAITLEKLQSAVGVGLRAGVARLFGRPLRIGEAGPLLAEPFRSGTLTARCHAEMPDAALVAEWDRLYDSAPDAQAFQSPAWQSMILRSTCPPTRLRLITVHDADRLIAVLPLRLRPMGWLETPGARLCDYLDPLLAAGQEGPAMHMILGLLRRLWDGTVGAIVWRNVPAESRALAAIRAVAADESFHVESKVEETAAVVRLPSTWDDYLAGLDRHERKETRRKLRKVEELNATITECDNPDHFLAELEAMLRIMERGGGPKGQAATRDLRPFLSHATPDLMKLARLCTLHISGKPVLKALALRSTAGLMMWNGGFEPESADLSPGRVFCSLAIRDAIAAGHTAFNMLRGQEAYKYHLGAKDQELHRVVITRSGPRR